MSNTIIKKLLRESLEQLSNNLGYRSGEFTGEKSDYLFDMEYRQTGHFGTGYYFFGDEKQAQEFHPERNVNIIDLNNYKLLNGNKELHGLLRDINKGGDELCENLYHLYKYLGLYQADVYNGSWDDMDAWDAYQEEKSTAENKLNNDCSILKNHLSSSKNGGKMDSLSTVVLKNLGYDGVDCRGTELDNSVYGSVIFDIKHPNDISQ